MSTQMKLTVPVEAHGEILEELTFREITTLDIRKCGQPFSFTSKNGSDKMQIQIDTDIAAKYIVRLAGIPEPSVSAMSPKDFMAAVMMVMDFFGDAMGMEVEM